MMLETSGTITAYGEISFYIICDADNTYVSLRQPVRIMGTLTAHI